MPDQMPAPPEGCVYGPWKDSVDNLWVAFNMYAEPAFFAKGRWNFDEVLEGPLCREIVRLRAELDKALGVNRG